MTPGKSGMVVVKRNIQISVCLCLLVKQCFESYHCFRKMLLVTSNLAWDLYISSNYPVPV